MSEYKYVGDPTSGKNSKDIKLPLSNGTFVIIKEVIPNETVITTDDSKSISFMQKNKNFIKIKD
jgi:hypothetical protein